MLNLPSNDKYAFETSYICIWSSSGTQFGDTVIAIGEAAPKIDA